MNIKRGVNYMGEFYLVKEIKVFILRDHKERVFSRNMFYIINTIFLLIINFIGFKFFPVESAALFTNIIINGTYLFVWMFINVLLAYGIYCYSKSYFRNYEAFKSNYDCPIVSQCNDMVMVTADDGIVRVENETRIVIRGNEGSFRYYLNHDETPIDIIRNASCVVKIPPDKELCIEVVEGVAWIFPSKYSLNLIELESGFNNSFACLEVGIN